MVAAATPTSLRGDGAHAAGAEGHEGAYAYARMGPEHATCHACQRRCCGSAAMPVPGDTAGAARRRPTGARPVAPPPLPLSAS
jgi:hypothetical protein